MRPVRKADSLTTILCLVMKSGNLNFLEPFGPLQACNGTDLLLPFTLAFQAYIWKDKTNYRLFTIIYIIDIKYVSLSSGFVK
jgi:hypothetical protein